MKRFARAPLAWRAVVGGAFLCGAALNAGADDTERLLRRIAVERFALASDASGMLVVQGARGVPRGQWQVSVWAGYAHKPLVLTSRSTGEEIAPLIEYRLSGGLALTYGVTARLAMSIAAPLVLGQAQGDVSDAVEMPTALTSWGIGDISLMPRAILLSQKTAGLDLGLTAHISLPSGRDDAYLTNGDAALGATLALARSWGRFDAVANLGYQTRAARYIANLEVNDELVVKLGARYALTDDARAGKLSVALATASRASGFLAQGNATAVELLAGGELPAGPKHAPSRWSVQAIAGMGLSKGYGVPAWRGVLSARLTLGGASPMPKRAATIPIERGVPVLDRDGDGVPDDAEPCPGQAEVFNGIDDHDGCPDTEDRDGDGVHDTLDLCLEEAETERAPRVPHDRFGCPYPAP